MKNYHKVQKWSNKCNAYVTVTSDINKEDRITLSTSAPIVPGYGQLMSTFVSIQSHGADLTIHVRNNGLVMLECWDAVNKKFINKTINPKTLEVVEGGSNG